MIIYKFIKFLFLSFLVLLVVFSLFIFILMTVLEFYYDEIFQHFIYDVYDSIYFYFFLDNFNVLLEEAFNLMKKNDIHIYRSIIKFEILDLKVNDFSIVNNVDDSFNFNIDYFINKK